MSNLFRVERFIPTLLKALGMDDTGMPVVCAIGGSDSSGGAGLQADGKTFSTLGVWGTSVVTAVTAQNTREVRDVRVLPPESIRLQIAAVLDDFDVSAFKTGMLVNRDSVEAVAGSLPARVPLVVDPVICATTGNRLLDDEGIAALVSTLLPRTTVVTPNVPETLVLTGMSAIRSVEEMRVAVVRMLALGPSYVVIKGGHLMGSRAIDLLSWEGGELILEGARFPYEVHGTGCCFAAAVTAYLGRGETVPIACRKAKEFVSIAIRSAVKSRSGIRMVHTGCRTGW